MTISLVAYLLVYIFLTNWIRIKAVFGSTIKKPVSYTNRKFILKYKEKTGIEFLVRIIKSDTISGAMAGLPCKPLMILSDKVFSELTEDERDWIICHEAGHCVKWHVLQTIVIWIGVFLLGILVINHYQYNLFASTLTGIIISILFYQLERYFCEYQADLYSMEKVDNLNGMIYANQKMRKNTKSLFYKHKLLTFLFTPHISYDTRIKMAQDRLNNKHLM
jgi:Zn-dependent protease with chaperone function